MGGSQGGTGRWRFRREGSNQQQMQMIRVMMCHVPSGRRRVHSFNVTPMTRDEIDQICASLPGAEWADPADGSLASWKVGGKMFACFGTTEPGVSVKTQSVEMAELLIEMGHARKAKYFHKSWVRLDFEALPVEEVSDRLKSSYDIVVASLPKKHRPS